MYKVKAGDSEFEITGLDKGQVEINGDARKWDMEQLGPNKFHVLQDNRSFSIEILETDYITKEFRIKVNGKPIDVSVSDRYDELLKQMGMEMGAGQDVKDVKAPMPGLVLDIHVQEGSQVAKGDPILVLEAMKMENILKSPTEGKVRSIKVEKKQAVEKNEVLIDFE